MNTDLTPKTSDLTRTTETAAENPRQVYIPAAILYNEALEAVAGTCNAPGKQLNVCLYGIYSS